MADFRSLQWRSLPSTHNLAEEMDRDIRRHRRERGRGGHRFNIKTLKSFWSADDIHVVLNHKDDSSWQHWYRDAKDGWLLIGWYGTRREAQAAAELPIVRTEGVQSAQSGIFVYARWTPEAQDTMKVHCSSDVTATEIMHVFTAMGCKVRKDLLSSSL